MSVGLETLDLFSAAAGGWSLGMSRAGFTTIAACEVEAWRRALYSENNPGVKVYDDVRTLTAARLLADLGRLPRFVVGSPPCQDISSANTKGKGVEGARSGLYFEAVRIIGEVRPRWFALENSSNLRTRGYDAVHAAVEAIGYTCWPCVVRAGDIGANHERARAWLIGCDLEQVADADGFGRDEGRGGRWSGFDVPVSPDPRHASQDGCGSGFPGRRAEPVAGLSVEACGDVGNADIEPSAPRLCASTHEGSRDVAGGCIRPDTKPGRAGPFSLACKRNTPHPDQARQARQAHGCMVSGLRQAEITNDGRGSGRGDDGSIAGQVAICPPDRRASDGGRADWSLADFADRLLLDDGLSAELARTRVAVGGPKGTSAASLIVEAFGDAVIPQIPEAIGRAILRTERALAAVYGAAA